ncbi:hypothetical protein ABC977_02855 [Thioalkalicoccus limnaeus]|uniref:Uncharacterized protein n=1 Tax=Thioalkalicoccus limnaeus TaxID=120681 RepID=A0ABV4BA94_9GAMM
MKRSRNLAVLRTSGPGLAPGLAVDLALGVDIPALPEVGEALG